jgi:hypothetical protein
MNFSLEQKHPSHISWRIKSDSLRSEHFTSSRLVKDIKKSKKILYEYGYQIKRESLTDNLLDLFYKKYSSFLEQKPRGVVFPIKDRIAENKKKGVDYFIISLYSRENVFLGGLIYSENKKENRTTTAYKTLPHSILERKRLPESLAYIFTLEFFNAALDGNFAEIFHGMDRNPYGFYSNIGLGLFKMRTGCVPFAPKAEKITFKNTIDYRSKEDICLWLGDTPETPITKAILITKRTPEEAQKEYKPLFLLQGVSIEIWDHTSYIASLPPEVA